MAILKESSSKILIKSIWCKIEGFTAVTMKNIVGFLGFHGGDYEKWCFWDVTPCGFCKNRRFGGT
jgi:hypothetical protein